MDTIQGMVNDFREELQRVILFALSRERFFVDNAFYGGTALRILYGLKRGSEDLDFAGGTRDQAFSWEPFVPPIRRMTESAGFAVSEITTKKGQSARKMLVRAMLKESLLKRQDMYQLKQEDLEMVHTGRKMTVRLEIDIDVPYMPDLVTEQVLSPSPFLVSTYPKPDLFAGKMHAVLCRQWERRVKGRDWYDMIWFLKQGIPVNLEHLEAKMKQSGHLEENVSLNPRSFRKIFLDVCRRVDFNRAFEDLEPFIEEDDYENTRTAFSTDMMMRMADTFKFI